MAGSNRSLEVVLRDKQVQFALAALRTPGAGHADKVFEYGRVCGVFSGLQMAIDEIVNIQRDEHDRTAAL